MPKQENTAINDLVNLASGGRLIESDPGENLFSAPPSAAMTIRGAAPPRAEMIHAHAQAMQHAPQQAYAQRQAPQAAPMPQAYAPHHAYQAQQAYAQPAYAHAHAPQAYAPQHAPAPQQAYASQPAHAPQPAYAQSQSRGRPVPQPAPMPQHAQPERSRLPLPRGRAQVMSAEPAVTMRGPHRLVERPRSAPRRAPAVLKPPAWSVQATVDNRPSDARDTMMRPAAPSMDSRPTIARQPQTAGTLPYAPTEPVRDLYAAARVPQPRQPVEPMPRHRAPASTPMQVPLDVRAVSPPVTASNLSVPALPPYVPAPNLGDSGEYIATVPIEKFAAEQVIQDRTAMVSPGPRPFVIELATTLKEFAAPIGILTVLAVFLGGYLAFDGQGGKKRSASAAAVVAAPVAAAVPAPEPSKSALSAAVITADPSLAPAEHVVNEPTVAPIAEPVPAAAAEPVAAPAAEPVAPTVPSNGAPTVAPTGQPSAAQIAMAELAAERAAADKAVATEPVTDEASDEIAMDATSVRRKKRSARRAKSALEVALAEEEAAKKRHAVEKPVSTRSEKVVAKRSDKVTEAELPANVADKTKGAPGKIVITSNKAALIYLDGRSTGMTAPKKFSVPAGAHKITLLDPDTRKAKTQDVDVVAGKTATVDKQFN